VEFPAGALVTGSIRLRSNVTLHLDRGAVIEASSETSSYDPPEPNQWDKFQDFGHSHFHNSLIWGEGLENIAITGGGRLSGKALTRGERGGGADKVLAIKLSRNVTLRDISIANGGHFGILATGVDNLTIDLILIDTNRDGIDIDPAATSESRIPASTLRTTTPSRLKGRMLSAPQGRARTSPLRTAWSAVLRSAHCWTGRLNARCSGRPIAMVPPGASRSAPNPKATSAISLSPIAFSIPPAA